MVWRTLSGDFIQINRYLVQELQNLNLWNENIRTKLRAKAFIVWWHPICWDMGYRRETLK
jgi:hypothetical protein